MNKISSLEKVIYDLLHNAYIDFQREKIFEDCYQGKYRYDFYLPQQNIAIEVNGGQHYEFISKFYKNRSEFMKAQERDRRKISYALAHGIKLYCIPYWEIKNLREVEDIFNPKFLAHNKFHNDDTWRAHQNR